MLKFSLLLIFICFVSIGLNGQVVTGKIVDNVNREPLIGAFIFSIGDTAISDLNGAFNLKGSLPIQIKVQYIGYSPSEFTITKNNASLGLKSQVTELGEVIVSAGASNRSVYASSASINIIDKTMLKRDASFTTNNAINRVPGVYLHSGTLNTNRLTIRGIGSRSLYGTNKIKAYYDEIPLTDGSGNSTIEDIDQNFIDRIEVIKGPNSSVYGAGLAGVVKLFSHRPDPLQTSVSMSQTIGSFGTQRFTALIDQSDGKNQLSVGYTDFKSEGFRENSDYQRKQIGLASRSDINSKSSISTLVQFTKLKAYIPSSISQTDYLNNPDKAAFTWNQARGHESYNKGLLGITYAHSINEGMDAKITIFGKFRDAYEPRPFNILRENTQTIGSRLVLSKQWQGTQLHFGSELFYDTYNWETLQNYYTDETNGSVEGALISENKENRYYQNYFVEMEHTLTPHLLITGGVNANFTNYTLMSEYQLDSSDNSGSYGFDPVLSPKIGLSYQFNKQALFFNISHGFSPPSLEETLYPDGQINPDIKPESGWNYETGMRGRIGQLNYDLTVYYMQIRNLLVAQRTAEDTYIGVNAGVNIHLGLDLLLNYAFELNKNYTFNIFYSGAIMHYRFGEFNNDGNSYNGNALTGVPSFLSNMGVEILSKEGFYGNINSQYVGRIPMDDGNSIYSNDYFLIRSRVGYVKDIKKFTIDIHLGGDNLGDTQYASMLLINAMGFNGAAPRYYYPGNPRNYYGGLQLRYTFRK